jgi:hypothetical protein
MGVREVDPLQNGLPPFYVCRRHGNTYHMHAEDKDTSWQDALRKPHAERYEIVIAPGYEMVNGTPRFL